MKEKIVEIFKDIDGTISSKRVFVFLSILILISSWVLDVFWELTATDYIFDGFLYVVAVGILGISAEKFVRWRRSNNENENMVGDTFDEIRG